MGCATSTMSSGSSGSAAEAKGSPDASLPTGRDLTAVRKEIASIMIDHNHDDGSYAPLFIRFAWHCSGTYDKKTNTGGSNGGTMRFAAEQADPENAGLGKARALLEPIKKQHSWMSYADLYILAGYVAIEFAGGPFIPFAYGRKDWTNDEATERYGPSKCPFGDASKTTGANGNPCGSRLPAADLGADEAAEKAGKEMSEQEKKTIAHVRATFTRMGFDDRETVLLIVLGHQFGRCHPDVSGFEDAWYAFDPAHWNVYEHGLGYMSIYTMLSKFREVETKAGKRQYSSNLMGGRWMMLITDMALYWDKEYKQWIQYYDRRRKEFKKEACLAWRKLTELGCDGCLTAESTPLPVAAPKKGYSFY